MAEALSDDAAEALLASYVADKVASVPEAARDLGLRSGGHVASRDRALEAGRRMRLLGYIRAGERLRQVAHGDARFDVGLMVFDATKELHRLRSKDGLNTHECDRLFDVSDIIDRHYAAVSQRAQDLSDHIAAAAAGMDTLLRSTGPTSHEAFESILGTLLGYHDYYGRVVRQFLLQAGDVTAATTGMRALGRAISWVRDAMAHGSPSRVMGAQALVDMVRETEGIVTTVPELRAMAMDEVRRCRGAMASALRRLGLPATRAGLQQLTSVAVSDPIGTASKQVMELRSFLGLVGTVDVPPMGEVVISAAEPFKPWSTAYMSYPGPWDADRRAFYRIAMPDPSGAPDEQRASLPWEELLLLTTVHEVYPGHALQHATQQATSRHGIRMVARSSTFSEGWAHYAEELVVSMGLRDHDPRVRVAQLQKSLMRACRVLATIEMHVEGTSIDGIIRMFERLAFTDPVTARKQAYRGIVEPGYLSYLLGKERILSMRRVFLGAGLGDIAAFHRWLLSHGAPPIPMLEDELAGMVNGGATDATEGL